MSRSPRTPRVGFRRTGLLAGGAVLAIAGGLLAAPGGLAPGAAAPAAAEPGGSGSAPAEFLETFDGAEAPDRAPGEWSVEQRNVEGMKSGWQGWSFHSTADVVNTWDGTGDRSSFAKGTGLVAVVQSDKNRPATGTFDSTLWSPGIPLSGGAQAVEVSFDSHYKQGQAPQNARLVARFDGGEPRTVQGFQEHRLNESAKFTVDAPAGARNVQFGWSYLQSSNNWFWMIDNVRVAEAAPVPVTPVIEGTRKPVASAGGTAVVALSGLRAGQQLTATVGSGTAQVPAADADGRATLTLDIPADQAPGIIPVRLSGEGANPVEFGITILAAGLPAYHSTEQQLWHSGFESDTDAWTADGATPWQFLDRAASLEQYGTDRRHAFTRASGTMAVAESSAAPFEGLLRSQAVPVPAPGAAVAGAGLELRLDSHFLKRGAGSAAAAITAVFDSGERVELLALGAETRESEQLRLPVEVPGGATSVTLEFAYAAAAGSGSWRIDDVELVRPLAPLADSAKPSAVVDVFSDVQGANALMRNNVIPGLRGLEPQARTIVSNGDLTSNGTDSQYNAYFDAFNQAAGDQYATKVSTIGNHEFFGANGSEAYISRFLDRTDMRKLAPEGADPAHAGLWGEVVVDGELPVLWIGSEFHNYPAQTGSGPFVEMGDEQFAWLQGRLAHWRAQNTPVVLFSHHVFNDSVSGTYAKFYQGDFAADTARLESLLAQNPNVTVLTSHTHWSPLLNDWSVEQRFDPSAKHGPTIVNTAAVTTQYGPSGDWAEKPVGGSDPVGLRVGLFDDRLRVTAYSFGSGGTPTELKHVDVPRPTEAPVDPEPQPDPELSLSAASVAQGGEVTARGAGFAAGEEVSVELRRADSAASRTARAARAASQSLAADADGAFSARVWCPRTPPSAATRSSCAGPTARSCLSRSR